LPCFGYGDEKVNARKIGGRTLVISHTKKTLAEIRRSLTSKHIMTDNGCVLGSEFNSKGQGQSTINLDTGEMIVRPNIDGGVE
jgi:hypothetical protein